MKKYQLRNKKQLDAESLTEMPYINVDLTIDFSEQRKKEEAIINQLI